ncbi:MAG: LytTR family transcriptional regulator [Lachnospiraceae bacterium]|nr:LytTR family transcriptional regulator [Lachnospiraceae bacterium]
MKVRLSVGEQIYEQTKKELLEHGIEIDDGSELELIERQGQTEYLNVKNEVGDRLKIRVDEIVFIESFGRNMDVHTEKEVYRASERMYILEKELAGRGFIRVSNSCIVARKKIKRIKPSLTMKYVLEMTDNSLVDVTRGYYYSFKEKLGV